MLSQRAAVIVYSALIGLLLLACNISAVTSYAIHAGVVLALAGAGIWLCCIQQHRRNEHDSTEPVTLRDGDGFELVKASTPRAAAGSNELHFSR